jgi:AcrR family transcriptional regulator
VVITTAADPRGGRRRETRERILAAAGRLFGERGFAAVTVAQIGAAAGVSAKTVFNYFPVKEGLFFAGAPPTDERLTPTVRHRRRGESAYEAVRRRVARAGGEVGLVRAVRDRLPDETVYEAIARFQAGEDPEPDEATTAARARAYRDSRELQAYAREQFARQWEALALILAADTGAEAGDPVPRVMAAALVAPLCGAYAEEQRLLADGHPAADVAEWRARDLARGYDALAPALADYARRPSVGAKPR